MVTWSFLESVYNTADQYDGFFSVSVVVYIIPTLCKAWQFAFILTQIIDEGLLFNS